MIFLVLHLYSGVTFSLMFSRTSYYNKQKNVEVSILNVIKW